MRFPEPGDVFRSLRHPWCVLVVANDGQDVTYLHDDQVMQAEVRALGSFRYQFIYLVGPRDIIPAQGA